VSDPDTTKIDTVTVSGVEVCVRCMCGRCGGRDGGYWRCPHCRHPMQNTSGAELATQRCAACGCPLGAATPTTRAVYRASRDDDAPVPYTANDTTSAS
jgi:hypothetical protein